MILDCFPCCRKEGRERDRGRVMKREGGRERDGWREREEGRGRKGEGRREREGGRGIKGEGGREREREGHSLYLKQLHIVEEVPGVELENENTVDPRSPPAICVDGERKEPQNYHQPSPQPSEHRIPVCPTSAGTENDTQGHDKDTNKNESHEPARSQRCPM